MGLFNVKGNPGSRHGKNLDPVGLTETKKRGPKLTAPHQPTLAKAHTKMLLQRVYESDNRTPWFFAPGPALQDGKEQGKVASSARSCSGRQPLVSCNLAI